MAKILAVANVKGGVGKTTTTTNLAAALVELGRKVLAVDLDPQSSLTFSLGVQPDKVTGTICDALDISSNAISSILQPTPERIDLVPGCHDLERVAHRWETTHDSKTFLRAALEPLRSHYDYILIDCPANAGILTIAALAAADEVIIPLVPDILSFQVLKWLVPIIAQVRENVNPTLRVAGVLLTMYDARTRHARAIIEALHKAYGSEIPFFGTVVKESVRLKEAVSVGKSVIAFAPDSQAAMAHRMLAEEIEKGIQQSPEDELYFALTRGDTAMQQHDFKAAYAAFCRATDIDSQLARAWLGRAESAAAWDEALRCLTQALLLGPQTQDIRTSLEKRLIDKIANGTPADIPEMIMLAHYMEEHGLNMYAGQLFRRVNELDALHEEAWLGQARNTSDAKEAVAYVQHCLELHPKSLLAQAALARAKERLQAAAQSQVEAGGALLKTGKRAEAHAVFQQAIELDPQNDRAWLGCAQTADDWNIAFDFAKQALEINPRNEEARLLYSAAWRPGGSALESAPRISLGRYILPLIIALAALAYIIAQLFFR